MNEQEFNQLWQRAEGAERGRRLATEYPAWQQARRRTIGMMALLAVVVAVAVPVLMPQHSNKEFEHIYCNRTGTSDAHWASLASTMLIES